MLSSQSDRRRRQQQPPRRPPSRGRPREGRAPRGRGGRAAPPSWWWQQDRRAPLLEASASVSPPVCPLCWCFTPAQHWDAGQIQAGDSGGDVPSPYLLHPERFCCCRSTASKSHGCTSTAEKSCCHCHAQLRCDADAQLEKPWAT
ncbi:hypothetical protein Q9966_001890 [Columba livia]|nr:hypothetical protein Q9966_001890 [Columba livia]